MRTALALFVLAGTILACGPLPASVGTSHERARAAAQYGASPVAARPGATRPTAVPPAPSGTGLPVPAISAASAVILDEASGAVLFARDEHRRMPPASLTKIATALVVIEAGDLDRVVETNPDLHRAWVNDSTVMGLQPGDRFRILDLLYGLMLVSGNDAAEVLALDAAGTPEAFVARMNALAARLGLQDTRFSDADGLGGPGHYSSAYDLALLSRYAMTFEAFRTIVGTEQYTAKGSRDLFMYNLNPLLNYTPGVDGVKTGFTDEAGRTFVASASRGGHRIYIVLLNVPTRAQDAIALIEWAFAEYSWQ